MFSLEDRAIVYEEFPIIFALPHFVGYMHNSVNVKFGILEIIIKIWLPDF